VVHRQHHVGNREDHAERCHHQYTSYFDSASAATVANPLAQPPPHIPSGIAAGPDGDMWFTDNGDKAAIAPVGTGQAAAAVSAPRLSGLAFTRYRLVCSATCTDWDGLTPSSSLFSFDGFRWLRNGVAAAGRLSSSYTPVAADVGHRLARAASVTYPLPLLATAVSTSSPATIRSAPVLTSLRVTPVSFVVPVNGSVAAASGFSPAPQECATHAGGPADHRLPVERDGLGDVHHRSDDRWAARE
jgi:hypothetical protein